MLSKSLVVIALAAFAQLQLVVATPPACLLGAVNQYDDASDIAAVCKSKDATSKITKLCGGSAKDALAAFADICNDKGVKVSTDIASASASASATASGTAGTAGTISPSASANSTVTNGSGSGTAGATPTGPTATSSGAPQNTGAASTLDFSAAALLAGLGIVVAAL